MRRILICLVLGGTLGAQAPFHIVAVEHRGLPPYESEDRVYTLDGGADRGLRVGDRMLVKRVGQVQALGHLWVTEVQGGRAGGRYEPLDETYPMRGDLALLEVLKWMPGAGRLDPDPLPAVPSPDSTSGAPPREGVLYFLPGQAELSPAGVKKLEGWVAEWGRGGQWGLQVPMAKSSKLTLQKQRAEALATALRALGLERVALETAPRAGEGKNDPAWVRHWD
jgi:hypothetical protein